MKKRLLKCALAMAALIVLAFFSPHIYWRIAGTVRGEAFYAGRPTSYWRDVAKQSGGNRGVALGPALPARVVTPEKTWHALFDEWKEKWRNNDVSTWTGLEKDFDAIPVLRELSRHEDSDVRAAAFSTLCGFGLAVRDDLPQLLVYLQNGEDSYARGRISECLPEIAGIDVLPRICGWLNEEDAHTALIASVTILRFEDRGAAAIPALIMNLQNEEARWSVRTLARIGAKAFHPLQEVMKVGNAHSRRHATMAIARMEDFEHELESKRREVLLAQMKDPDPLVRIEALVGIDNWPRQPDAAYAIVHAFNTDPDDRVQSLARTILRGLGSKKILAEYNQLAINENLDALRAATEKALEKIDRMP